jgi:hypothetical protein
LDSDGKLDKEEMSYNDATVLDLLTNATCGEFYTRSASTIMLSFF